MSIADGDSPIGEALTLFIVQLLLVCITSKLFAMGFKFIKGKNFIDYLLILKN